MYSRNRGGGSFGLIIGVVLLFFFFSTLFYSAKFIYGILSAIAPLLIIATIFINFGVIKDYINMVLAKLKDNIGIGLIYAIGSFVLFPLLAGFLFYKAISEDKTEKKMRKEFRKKNKGKQDDYIPFEEVEDDAPLDFEKMRQERKSFEEIMQEKEMLNNNSDFHNS